MWTLALIFSSFRLPTVQIDSTVINAPVNKGPPSASKQFFEEFVQLNHKVYSDANETARRAAIFHDTLSYIRSLNALHNGSLFGVTRFADHTLDELHARMLLMEEIALAVSNLQLAMKLPPRFDDGVRIAYAKEEGSRIPRNFDWRSKAKVTPVKDQGTCNACWAFAATAVIESSLAINNDRLTDLSEQQLIDCDPSSDGCSFGYPATAYLVAQNKGLAQEAELSYQSVKSAVCPSLNGSVFVESVQRIRPNAQAIADYIYHHGPVSVNLKVTVPLYYYSKGIFRPSVTECNASSDYHVWTLVGFGEQDGRKYWIAKNSWGTNWGDGGYIHYARGEDLCGIERFPYSAIVHHDD